MTIDKARAALRTLRAVLTEKGLTHLMRSDFNWGSWGSLDETSSLSSPTPRKCNTPECDTTNAAGQVKSTGSKSKSKIKRNSKPSKTDKDEL
jgi:hypothetical protein